MKNMKRLLALVLVMVMVFAFVPFASAGPADMNVDDYIDFDDIPTIRREAVDVLTALGILTGYETTGGYEFRGDRNVTRAEAAKIISYILLGKAAADRLVQTNTQFRDVPASHWASGFVAYCATRNVINGYPDGTFLPEANVTGAQIAKMLLIALGYGRNDEYVGNNWQINAIVDGQRVDRTAGVVPGVRTARVAGTFDMAVLTGTADFSAPATRMEIAAYTFNTLRKNMVEYSQFLGYLTGYEEGMLQIGPQINLGRNTFNLRFQETTDDFGYGWRYWHLNNINRPITIEYTRDTVHDRFIANADHTRNYMAINYNWADNWSYLNGGLLYYINGTEGRLATETSLVQRGNNTIVFPPGAQVTLMRDGNDIINKIIIEYELLGRVTGINSNAGTVTANVYMPTSPTATGYSPTIFAEGFVRNDWILISPRDTGAFDFSFTNIDIDPIVGSGGETLRVKEAGTLVGRATSTSGNFPTSGGFLNGRQSITVDGTRYQLGAGIGYGFGNGGPGFTDSSTFYLDSFGTIIGYEAAVPFTGEASLQYTFVVDVGSQTGLGVGNRRSVAMYTTDGKYHELPIAQYRVSGGTAQPAVLAYSGDNRYPTSGNSSLLAYPGSLSDTDVAGALLGVAPNQYHGGKWFSYIITDDNEVILKELATSVANRVNVAFDWDNSLVTFASAVTFGSTGSFSTRAINANSNLTMVEDGNVRRYEGSSRFPRNDDFTPVTMTSSGIFRTALVVLAQTQDNIEDSKNTAMWPTGRSTTTSIAQIYIIDSDEGFGDSRYAIMVDLVADYGTYEVWELLTVNGIEETKIYKSSGSTLTVIQNDVVRIALRAGTTDIYDVQLYTGGTSGGEYGIGITGVFESADSSAVVINSSTVYTVTADTLFLRWDDIMDNYAIAYPQVGAGTVLDDLVYIVWTNVAGGANNTAVAVISQAQ